MQNMKFGVEPTDNWFVVTRMVQVGVNQDTGEPVFSATKIVRETLGLAFNEIRGQLDACQKEYEKFSKGKTEQKS